MDLRGRGLRGLWRPRLHAHRALPRADRGHGYQTNLMVYGAGGYRFGDFLRIGLPMNALLWVTTTLLAPIFWPF